MVEEKISMEDVIKQFDSIQNEKLVKGTIIGINEKNNNVIVDIGCKSEGIIPLQEFEDEQMKIGDEIEVYIVKRSLSYEYPPLLSFKRAQAEHRLDELEKAFDEKLVIDVKIEKKVKGGLIVGIGEIKAFMPASLVGYPMVKNLDSVMDKVVPAKIIEFDRKNKNIIVSWRTAVEDDVRRKREELFEQLYPGKVIKGVITGMKSFGAFVDLGGVDGLLHISELSWGHVDKVEDILKIGQEVEVKIKSFNPKSNRISLSLKETQPHPWENILEIYPPGCIVDGKVTGVTSYGAFIELKPGVEGLARIEEMSWTDNIKHAGDKLEVNEKVKIKVIEVDPENKKISLSIKQAQPNPWEEVKKEYQVGNIIEGEVTHTTDFGAFLMLKEGVEGLIHVSDMSWRKEAKHPSEYVKVGDTIKAKLLSIDSDKQKISLGLKQLDNNPYENYPVGTILDCTVKAVQRSGAYLNLDYGLEAYLHISNYSKEKIEDLRKHLKTDDTLEKCKVIKNVPSDNLIEVSIIDFQIDEEKKEIKKYMEPSGSGATLYDLLGDKLDGLSEIEKKK